MKRHKLYSLLASLILTVLFGIGMHLFIKDIFVLLLLSGSNFCSLLILTESVYYVLKRKQVDSNVSQIFFSLSTILILFIFYFGLELKNESKLLIVGLLAVVFVILLSIAIYFMYKTLKKEKNVKPVITVTYKN